MSSELAVTLTGAVVFALTCTFFSIKIAKIKKNLKSRNADIPKPAASYAGSLICCLIAVLLPVIIPMNLIPILIVELCASMGATVVFNDRIENLRKN